MGFPGRHLAGRELGAYLVSTALGWNIVPLTIIRRRSGRAEACSSGGSTSPATTSAPNRPGPELVDLCPPGSIPPGYLSVLHAYDYAGNDVTLVHADDVRLLRMAVFDVIVNNADRKGGHILRRGRTAGCTASTTGCGCTLEDKLRTVLWGWAGKPIDDETLEAVAALGDELAGRLADELASTSPPPSRRRCGAGPRAADEPVMPGPDRHRPIPWPAF